MRNAILGVAPVSSLRRRVPGPAVVSFALAFLSSACAAEAQAPVTMTRELPSGGRVPEALAEAAFDRFDSEAGVRWIYERFTGASERSGQQIKISLSEFRTHRSDSFADLRLLAVISPHKGPLLQTTHHSRWGSLPSQRVFSYESRWEPGNAEDAERMEREGAEVSIAQVLAAGSALEGPFPRPIALTTYRVALDFAGKSVAYQAAVTWFEHSRNKLFFTVGDPVVEDLLIGFEEEQTIVPLSELNSEPVEPPGYLPAAQCLGSFEQHDSPYLRLAQTGGHSSGQHQSILTARTTCQTSERCTSTCTTEPMIKRCADSGFVSNILFKHVATEFPDRRSIQGLGVGLTSECAYALGCAIEECLATGCRSSPTFTLEGDGAGFEISVAGTQVIADLGVEHGATCPAARLYVPLPPRCEELASSVVALPLRPLGAPRTLPIREGVQLSRLAPSEVVHHGAAVSYLMAEWALVSASVNGIEVRQRATAGFDEEAAKEVALAAWGQQDSPESVIVDQKVLLVAVPSHEPNSRAIAIPELRLQADLLPPTRERGNLLVRADFGEDHRLEGLGLVHSENGAGSWNVMLAIERALTLEPSTERHRVVTFAWLSIGETIKIESALSYLPRCCCGTVFCA
jgi:hypothetical protein